MPLCSACTEIDLRHLVASAYLRHTSSKVAAGNEELTDEIIPYKHRKTRFEIEENAKLCDCCAVIWEFIPRYELGTDPGTHPDVYLYVLFRGYEDPMIKARMVVRVGNEEGLFSGDLKIYKRMSEDDPIEKFLEPILPKNSGLPECLSKAKQWLTACESSHPDCNRADGNSYPLPTRVLRVGNDNTHPSLYETQGKLGRWVTLSYCWGAGGKLQLTKENQHELLQGIPLGNFPATIRDAILVARSLDIQYIWIDALCIIQNYLADWDREAPKMAHIYTHAVLTIINGDADSADSGIFCDRSEYGNGWQRGPSCTLPWRQSSRGVEDDSGRKRKLESVTLSWVQQTKNGYAGPSPERHKWATRGWTLQEELLSWRTLTFMKNEILWGCPSKQVWECGQPRIATVDYSRTYDTETARRAKPNLGLVKLSQIQHQASSHASDPPGLVTLSKPQIYRAWYSMVEEYSKRKLSHDTDKLMAIAGMARDVQQYIPDIYCAGLWDKDLIAGLIWEYDNESWSHLGKPFQANSDSGLPSWSWASINEEVFFPYKEQSTNARFGATEQFVEVARVDKLKARHFSQKPNGPTSSAELVLTGPSYCCYTVDINKRDHSELHKMLLEKLKADPEYKARHKEHENQKIMFQQLAWIEDFEIQYGSEQKRRAFRTCALLVVETKTPDALSVEADETYRRVSLLMFRGVDVDMKLLQQPAWPVETIGIT